MFDGWKKLIIFETTGKMTAQVYMGWVYVECLSSRKIEREISSQYKPAQLKLLWLEKSGRYRS